MNCRNCQSNFSLEDPRFLPRVLIECGHTLCHSCISKKLVDKEIQCPECQKINQTSDISRFPVNQTLMALLKANLPNRDPFQSVHKEQSSDALGLSEAQLCTIHNKRLEAYCQKDKELLCLNCVLSASHKNHQITSVSEKVEKDKSILRQCHDKMLSSHSENFQKFEDSSNLIEQINLDYKQFLFEIGLLYKNITAQLEEEQSRVIKNACESVNESLSRVEAVRQKMIENNSLHSKLNEVYQELMGLDDLKYLNEEEKRVLLVHSCQYKSPKLQYEKLTLDKLSILESSVHALEELVKFERRKNLSRKKSQSINSSVYTSEKGYDQLNSDESPSRFSKKVSHKSSQNKEPQILEVNLTEHYQRYHLKKENAGRKKREDNNLCSSPNSTVKTTKIEYEVKREKQHPNKSVTHRQQPPAQKDAKMIPKKWNEEGSCSRKSGRKPQHFEISVFDGSEQCSPIKLNQGADEHKDILSVGTPVSINSFMDSSRFTIKDSFSLASQSLKDSRQSFTLSCFEEKVYHFGGLNVNSVACTNLNGNGSTESMKTETVCEEGINRNKCQCVVLEPYSAKKVLVLGGKNANGERTSSILEFDIEAQCLKKSILSLDEAISGFGAVCFDEKLYVFGGSSSSPLNTLIQYRLGSIGLHATKLCPMLNSRDELGFAMGYDGFLYACGGINSSNTILNSCERYDFAKNKWFSIPPMKFARRSFSLVSLPNGLYAIGGHDGRGFLKAVEFYDYYTNKWTEAAPLHQARFTHTAVTTNDYQTILVFGGFENQALKTVERFDVISGKWHRMPSLDKERFLHCSIFLQEA